MPSAVQPGPQWITSAVPVAEGAVTIQFVVFKPSPYTVSVAFNGPVCPCQQVPAVGGWVVSSGNWSGHLNVAVAVSIVCVAGSVYSAMMVTEPDAYAVTIPALALDTMRDAGCKW